MVSKRIIGALFVVFLLSGIMGIYLTNALQPPAIQIALVDEKGRPLTEISKNVEVQVQIDALVPTREVYRTIFLGSLEKPSRLKFWDSGNTVKISLSDEKLQSVLYEWKRIYPKGIGSSLMISVWVLDHENGKLYRGFAVVNYNTAEVSKGIKKTVKINIHKLPSSPLEAATKSDEVAPLGSNRQFYYWKTDWSLSWVPSSYVKVPVLVVDNKYSQSSVVTASVNIIKDYYTKFGLTIAYGHEISKKSTPSLDIYGNDFHTVEDRYYFYKDLILAPNEKGYIYIYAKPYHLHQKEYYCTGSLNNCVPTGEERVQEGINDISTSGDVIQGGSSMGLPTFASYLFDGSSLSQGTVNLGVNKSISLGKLISQTGGSCGANFGIGIPIGAMAVYLSGGMVPPWAAGLTAGIHYDHYQSLEIYGGISNHGRWRNTGEDIFETLRIGVSKYTYHVGTCDTKVPIGIYIESD